MNNAGGGSIITLTYLGAERVVPNYNMMGIAKASLEAGVRYLAQDLGQENIRVNGISAGPIKTLAARGIADLNTMMNRHAEISPLRRNVELEEVAGTALFLASPLSSGITGEVIHVDCGYSIMAM
jgi:enoyl-[acyl-carrier protein] reductase I